MNILLENIQIGSQVDIRLLTKIFTIRNLQDGVISILAHTACIFNLSTP